MVFESANPSDLKRHEPSLLLQEQEEEEEEEEEANDTSSFGDWGMGWVIASRYFVVFRRNQSLGYHVGFFLRKSMEIVGKNSLWLELYSCEIIEASGGFDGPATFDY